MILFIFNKLQATKYSTIKQLPTSNDNADSNDRVLHINEEDHC